MIIHVLKLMTSHSYCIANLVSLPSTEISTLKSLFIKLKAIDPNSSINDLVTDVLDQNNGLSLKKPVLNNQSLLNDQSVNVDPLKIQGKIEFKKDSLSSPTTYLYCFID